MTYCPSVCRYRVTFSDGTVTNPTLPGNVDVRALADQYARETLSKGKDRLVIVVTIERLYDIREIYKPYYER